MTKVKLKDATKELAAEAQKVLGDATRVRKGADSLVQSLKKLENRFQREKEEAAAQLRREEQQKAAAAHSKAFTMLDDEEKAQVAAVQAAAEAEKARAEAAAREEKARAEAAEKAAQEQARQAAEEKARAEAAAKAAEAAHQQAKAEKPAEKPAPAREEKPAAQPKADKPAEPKKPAIGQIISRPGQQVQPQKPVGLAPNVIRAPQPRPVQQGQGASRPAGPYGRPANPQGQQGGFARPAQGGAPRPQGGFAQRPAGAPGAGGYGQRPQGGAPRPAGGGRPGMGRSKGPELTPVVEKERVSNYDPNKKNYVRQHDPERVTRNRKQEARNNFSGYDDDVIRGGKRSRVKKPSAQQMMAPIKIETAYMAGDTIVVRDLCEKIGKTSGEIIKKLFLLGNMATINSEIDFDTAQLVCSDFDITLERKAEQTAEDALVAEDFDDAEENLEP